MSLMAVGTAILLGVSILSLIVALVSDIKKKIIPNTVSLFLSATFFLYALTHFSFSVLGYHCLVALGLFLLGYGLYIKKYLGAGDVKLMTALGLWAGPFLVIPLVVITTITGGILAIGYSLVYKSRGQKWETVKMPYGPALVLAGLVIFNSYVMSFIQTAKHLN